MASGQSKSRWARWAGRAWRVVRIPLLFYGAVLVAMMLLENWLMFPAMRFPQGQWQAAEAYDFEDVFFRSADGTQLHGWYARANAPRGFLLFCHGNAGNITHRAETVDYLRRRFRLSVFVFDYRGYGQSEGRADETGVLADGRAAHAWLAERAAVEPHELILLGRSLGGAIAVDLAARHGAGALILHSTFTSAPDAAANLYPWLPVRWLMRTKLNSLEKIPRYRGPVLVSHGSEDEIIDMELGKRLFAAAPGEKTFVSLEGAGHNDPLEGAYFDALESFLSDRVWRP